MFLCLFTEKTYAIEEIDKNFNVTKASITNNQFSASWVNLPENHRLRFYIECECRSGWFDNYFSTDEMSIKWDFSCKRNCENYSVIIRLFNQKTEELIEYDSYVLSKHNHEFEKKILKKSKNNSNGIILHKCNNCDSFEEKQIKSINNLKISVKNNLNESIISWNKISCLDGYEIWRKVGDENYKKYKTITGNKISVSNSVSAKYKIRGYIEINNENIIATDFTSSVKVEKPKISLKLDKKQLNGYTYSKITHNKAKLKWNKIDGASGYKIYKYNSNKKKYLLYKTINDPKTTSLSITNLSPNTKYYFKIKTYNDKKSITSNKISFITFSKTTGYFYDRVVWNETWSGILITREKASSSTMSKYKINGNKTPIKYNFSRNDRTLYVHVYTEFKGPSKDKKFELYKLSNNQYKKYNTSKYTYKELVKSGIQKYWEISVKGNQYDFTSNCNFKINVIIHDKNLLKNQKRIIIDIGSENCYLKHKKLYWAFTKNCVAIKSNGTNKYLYDENIFIYLPSNYQLSKNNGHAYAPYRNVITFKNSAAHEFGHALGLEDTYILESNGKTITRISPTTEVGYYESGVFRNIMKSCNNVYAVQNDIEMALQAQGEAIKNKPNSFQGYKTIKNNPATHDLKKSVVIRK